jgi:Ca-activated chloride channel family protein
VLLLGVSIVIVVAVSVLFGRAGDPNRATMAKRIAVGLMIGAVLLLILGFTQLRFFHQSRSAATVVLVLDVSESMSRDDVEPTRMQAAKQAATVFLEEAPEDLTIGLVSFGGSADVLAPPTGDRSVVEDALVGLPRSEGTVIGDGLDTAVTSIQDRWLDDGKGPAAIVLLSDGRDTGSTVQPLVAAEAAARLDIPVYTVVLGQGEEAGGAANDTLLADIARTTDGASYTATTASGLIDVYRQIQDQLVTALEITNVGAFFVTAAFGLAVAATVALLSALRAEVTGANVGPRPKRLQRDRPPRRKKA